MGHFRKLSSVAFFVVLISSIGLVNIPYMPQASAHGFFDLVQENSDSSDPLDDGISPSILNDAQRFFPTVSDNLVAVDITLISEGGSPPGDFIVRIYEVNEGFSIIATETVSFSSLTMVPDDPVTFHVDLTSAPALVAGIDYYLDVSASVPTDAQWLFHSVDQISPGSAFFAGTDSTTSDFWFKTSMLNPVVVGGCVVDQENDQPVDGQVPLDVISSGTFNDAQDFILSASGDVVVVDVEVVSESGSPPGNLIVRIYDDTKTFVEVEGTVPIPALSPNIPQIISVSMPPNFLVGGDTYSIDVSVDTASDLTWARNSATDTYPPGVSFSNGAGQSADYNFAICVFFDTAALIATVNILADCAVDASGAADFGSLTPGFPSSEEVVTLDVTGSADADIHYNADHWFGIPAGPTIMDVSATAFDTIGSTTYASKTPFPHVSAPIVGVGNLGVVSASTLLPTFLQVLPNLLDESFSGFLNQDIFVTFACVIDFLTITGSPDSGLAGDPVTGMTSVEFRDYLGNVDPSFIGQITLEIDQDSTGGVAVLTCSVCVNGVATLPAAIAGTVVMPADLVINTPGTFTFIVQFESTDPFETASFTLT